MSPGDDVYVSICQGLGKENGAANSAATAALAAPLAASSAPAGAASAPAVAEGEKLAKKLKVYVHYEAAADSKDPTATSVCTVEDTAKSVGNVIEEFTAGERLCEGGGSRVEDAA